ncbi:N-6 DNA methylase [Vibrio ziniensis]|uniref:site-specific DNA-methyltransferase (adenine-specific) n=1 Tax=Vibrio ziniensis TaxID=2711221 RepID=A0A6G7CMW0_9VIBR|nr:N-6 DNA methylase [Vibrio ziniensis]QIH43435.1 N-6 DNA methylase [Vibrio ziniensis]
MSHRTEFEKTFKHFAPYHHRHKVWDDLITCFAISINNGIAKDEELENKYLGIIRNYERNEQLEMPKLVGMLVCAFEESGHCDLLGEMYMAMEISSKNLGQFFTPYSLSKLCAKLSLDKQTIETKNFITAHEPACGSGGMIIAQADVMIEEGYNPQEKLLAYCVDVDQTAAMMCYIQLALWGIPAKVTIGNTLTMQFSRTMLTPMYHLGGWSIKEMIGQRTQEPETNLLVKRATTIIKHCSEASTEVIRSELLEQLQRGASHQKVSIIQNVSRVIINDSVYDLMCA